MSARWLRHGLDPWPPFLFAGIHVAAIGDDFRSRARGAADAPLEPQLRRHPVRLYVRRKRPKD